VSRRGKVFAVIAVGGLLAAGCADFRIERDGKKTGEALCDVKNADNKDEVDDALNKARKHLEDAQRIVGRPVGEDVDDVQENVSDLSAHVLDGQENLAKQDIANIRRNVEAASGRTRSGVQRYYQGVVEGLGDCTD
jgi:hypothetical protein